jgi:hypothetical protein
VTANCISPFAWTRMIGTIPTETETQKARVEKIKKLSPAHIAPVAVFLASDAARDVTGQVFGVRGKEIMLFGHERPIMRVHHDEGWTPERIAEMFAGNRGMGFLMQRMAMAFKASELFAATLIVSILSIVVVLSLEHLNQRLSRWR